MRQASKWTFMVNEKEQGPRRARISKYVGKAVELANLSLLADQVVGSTLNLCCGYDNTGDVLVDLDRVVLKERQQTLTNHQVRVNADVQNLPFAPKSFDTVVCDPDYAFYGKLGWIHELFKIARQRVILSAPPVDIRPPKSWTRELYYVGSNHIFLRLWWVFTADS